MIAPKQKCPYGFVCGCIAIVSNVHESLNWALFVLHIEDSEDRNNKIGDNL